MSVASRSGFGVVIEGDVVDKCRNQKHSGVVVDPSLAPRCGFLDMGSNPGDGGADPVPCARVGRLLMSSPMNLYNISSSRVIVDSRASSGSCFTVREDDAYKNEVGERDSLGV